MPRSAALPFNLRRSEDVLGSAEMVLRARRWDALAAEESTADLALVLAELSLPKGERPEMLAPPWDSESE